MVLMMLPCWLVPMWALLWADWVVLMDDHPSKIATAIRIARRTLTIARQNIAFAIGVKVAVLLLAVVGLATMWLAVFADVGVTVLAVCRCGCHRPGCPERHEGTEGINYVTPCLAWCDIMASIHFSVFSHNKLFFGYCIVVQRYNTQLTWANDWQKICIAYNAPMK